MYSIAKVTALCAQLFLQQQQSLEDYNRTAYYSRAPIYIVNSGPVAAQARRAQARYYRYCQ